MSFSKIFIIISSILLINNINGLGKQYKELDDVPLIANRVGPFANPSEIYSYYFLPFCKPPELQQQSQDLGELLSGDRKVKSGYELVFKVDVPWRKLCRQVLTEKEVKAFETAVDEDYYFELFIDNLPIWGYVGDSDKETELMLSNLVAPEPHKYVYTHLHFSIAYNDSNIVDVNVTANPSSRFDITAALLLLQQKQQQQRTGGVSDVLASAVLPQDSNNKDEKRNPLEIDFSYSVKWIPSDMTYAQRMERHTKMHSLPATYQIHWLSIVNSFVLVILLTVFLAIILMRVLKNDFTRYLRADEEEEIGEEETGWKLIHGDVFRIVENKMIFTAMLGAGTQLFVMVLGVLTFAVFSVANPNKRGSIPTAMVTFYALTSGIGGYVSARYYRQFGGTSWVWNVILAALLFPGPLFFVFSFLNTVAFYHGSSAALPIGTILVILALYALVTFPLTVVGGIAGRNSATDFDAPCRTTKVPRQIPDAPWYRQAIAQYFMAGFLPFSSIYIEIHYVFASVWGHRQFALFGVLFLAFVLLLIVTSFITIALTYFQLAIEDHRWWWRSFISGGSTAFFVYAYSFFYFFERSEMSGFMQETFFFGYMAVACFGIFLLLGTVGFFSSLYFVRSIYRTIKAN